MLREQAFVLQVTSSWTRTLLTHTPNIRSSVIIVTHMSVYSYHDTHKPRHGQWIGKLMLSSKRTEIFSTLSWKSTTWLEVNKRARQLHFSLSPLHTKTKGRLMGFKVELDVADPVESNCEACPSLGFWEDTERAASTHWLAGSDLCACLCTSSCLCVSLFWRALYACMHVDHVHTRNKSVYVFNAYV